MLTNLPIEEIEWVIEQGSAYIKKNKNSKSEKQKTLTRKQKTMLYRAEYENYRASLFK